MDRHARIAALEAENAQQRALITRQQTTITQLTEKIAAMEQRLSAMNRRIFGASSERVHDTGQQNLDLGGNHDPFVNAAATTESTAATDHQTPGTAGLDSPVKRRTPRRPRVPENIEVVEHVVDVPEHDRIGIDGHPLVRLTDAVSERLDYIPSHFRRLRIVRPIYGRPFADAETQPRVVAEPPAFLVKQGLPTDALAIQVVINKYCDHLPLYRQAKIWAREHVHIPRSTLCGWVGAVCERLRPVWNAIGDEVRSERYLHLDDTPIRVLAPTKCLLGRLWTYAVPDAVHLRYAESRAGQWPGEFLGNYHGYIVGDAYAGHDALFLDGTRTRIGCWAHVRRKFEEIHKQETEAVAMLRRIGRLYRLEEHVRLIGADENAIMLRRASEATPILDDIRRHLDRLAPLTTPQSPLGKAVSYAIHQWENCTRYVNTGFLPIDNNLAERSIRPVAIGRKNYLFLGSGEAGDWAAIAYSLIGSCDLNGLDPRSYLLDIAPRLTERTFTNYAELTPRAWAKQKNAVVV